MQRRRPYHPSSARPKSRRTPASPPPQTGNLGPPEEVQFESYNPFQQDEPAAPPQRQSYQSQRAARQEKSIRPGLLRERVITAAPGCFRSCDQCGQESGIVRCLDCAHAYQSTILCASCDRRQHQHAHFHVRQHPGTDGWWAPLAPQQDVSDEGFRVEASKWCFRQ